jgi:hypothetical protein
MSRYYDTVGGLYTHLANNNDIAYFTVDGNANGVKVAVTSTSKTIRILKSGVYEITATANVNFRAYAPGNASPTAATNTASDNNGVFLANAVYNKKLEQDQTITVITSSTAGLVLAPVELK